MHTNFSDTATDYSIQKEQGHWKVAFTAMACPCEILVRTDSSDAVEQIAAVAFDETRRIEHKFSRYRDDNIVHKINNSHGQPVKIDSETLQLLEYAGNCFLMSEGLFDITSGILRRAWSFKGEKFTPDRKLIKSLLKSVGWNKVQITDVTVTLKPDMEIDFGGFGKEYAVDKVAQLLSKPYKIPIMVNFGGDIMVVGTENSNEPWCVGISDPERPDFPIGYVDIFKGAVTTSGVSYRHCFVNGKRLGHVLNPKTGWPVEDAPKSVTVVGNFCLEAGMLSTLAMLYGKEAETFLKNQKVQYHCIW